jgi:antitoxin ParD1/3/4
MNKPVKAPEAAEPLSINVRVSGALRAHVETMATEGDYETVSEYVRDLIRKDKATREEAAFQSLKAELKAAFAEPIENYKPISMDDIRAAYLARKT